MKQFSLLNLILDTARPVSVSFTNAFATVSLVTGFIMIPAIPSFAISLKEANLEFGLVQSTILDLSWQTIQLSLAIENNLYEPNSSQHYSGVHNLSQDINGNFLGDFSATLQGKYLGGEWTINYAGNILFPFNSLIDPDCTLTSLNGTWKAGPDEDKKFSLSKDPSGKTIPGKLSIDDSGKGTFNISLLTEGQTDPIGVDGPITAKKKDGKTIYETDRMKVKLTDGTEAIISLKTTVDNTSGNVTSEATGYAGMSFFSPYKTAATNTGTVVCNSPCKTDIEYVSQPVPEPLTILGSATAAGFGAFFKRKRKLSESSEKDNTKAS